MRWSVGEGGGRGEGVWGVGVGGIGGVEWRRGGRCEEGESLNMLRVEGGNRLSGGGWWGGG